MRTLEFRILNVFTAGDDRLSGNPLAVFEDGSALSDQEMQALAPLAHARPQRGRAGGGSAVGRPGR